VIHIDVVVLDVVDLNDPGREVHLSLFQCQPLDAELITLMDVHEEQNLLLWKGQLREMNRLPFPHSPLAGQDM